MKKLLFVANHSSHGGSLKMFTWLANAMVRYYEVSYCNLSGTKPFYELDSKVEYIELNSKKSNSFIERNTIGFLKNVNDLAKLIKENKIDTVVNFADHALYALIVAKFFTQFKLVISQRVDPFSCVKKTDLLRLKLYRFCDGLVCQTDSAQTYFETSAYNRLKKRVIPNPTLGKTQLRWDMNNNEGYILSLARIDLEQKRQDILIQALKIVHERYPNVKARFYGKEVRDSIIKLNEMIRNSGLSSNIEYCGVTENSYEVLCNAAMMVLTSDYEGIPNAIIEAMEVGVPIITTDCKPGGARLLIDTDDKGKVVECGNPKALAQAIIAYLNDPENAADCALNAHNSLYRFDEEVISKKWKEFIESV